MKTERFKNPWFWVGVVSVALTAIGVDPQTFTYYAGQPARPVEHRVHHKSGQSQGIYGPERAEQHVYEK